MRTLFLLLLVAGLAFSCAQRKVASPEAGEAGAVSGARAGEGETVGEQELAAVQTEDIQGPSAMKLTEEEIRRIFKDIHFDYDRYDIKDEDKPTLRAIADWMLNNPPARLVIEGHCDERGTNEYNLGLGDRRARATKDYLVSLGVSARRLQTVSYGEERPLCTEKNEGCWRQNRRAHFVVVKEEASK